MLITIFWILIAVILYSYFGYTILLLIIAAFVRRKKNSIKDDKELPEVTLLIAAYNESAIIREKIENSMALDYPSDKLKKIWITDGSTDESVEMLRKFSDIVVLHEKKRSGKSAAISRAMKFVSTPIVVFCDANTMLASQAIRKLVGSFKDEKVGCVAGEKKISPLKKDKASGFGEGTYWKYESFIKRLEAKSGSALGAAGELYAIRTELFEAPESDIILDDFLISLAIAHKGYKIEYEPEAYAFEDASFNMKEEKKRKIRIAAGSFQVLFKKLEFLNFVKHFMLSFQYLSHKVLRWIVVPFAFFSIFFINLFIICWEQSQLVYFVVFILQCLFYLMVIFGGVLRNKKLKFKSLFIPFYLAAMNYFVLVGFYRFLFKGQSVAWEKSVRSKQ